MEVRAGRCQPRTRQTSFPNLPGGSGEVALGLPRLVSLSFSRQPLPNFFFFLFLEGTFLITKFAVNGLFNSFFAEYSRLLRELSEKGLGRGDWARGGYPMRARVRGEAKEKMGVQGSLWVWEKNRGHCFWYEKEGEVRGERRAKAQQKENEC